MLRGGYGRVYDIGVFGSLFGHSVTQNLPVLAVQELNAPSNFDRVFTLAHRTAGADLPDGAVVRPLPAARRRLRTGPARQAAAADGRRVQRHRPASADDDDVDRGGICRQSRPRRLRRRRSRDQHQPGVAERVTQGVPQNNRKPFFNKFGWTQGIDYFCNCATNSYDSLQAKLTKRFSSGLFGQRQLHAATRAQHGGDQFETDLPEHQGLYNSDLELRPARLGPGAQFRLLAGRGGAGRQGRTYMSDASALADAFIGGWQFNTNTTIQSGLPFNVTYRDAGPDRDTGPNRPDLIGDPDGPKTRDQWFNAAPIGAPSSAFGRPARGTFGNLERNALRGPGYWRVDASAFKHFPFGEGRNVELRLEVVNLFNHVNLGNPNGEVGVPGNNNTDAGRITSTAFGNADPQRNFQFAAKISF